jgi:hypothetical protein
MRYFAIFLLVAFMGPAFAQSPGPAGPPVAQAGSFQVEKLPRGDFALYYRVGGVGRPVVIFSGGPGDDSEYLMPVAQDVARSAQAIVPELRGTGRSLPPRGPCLAAAGFQCVALRSTANPFFQTRSMDKVEPML